MEKQMAGYLALRIMDGTTTYKAVFIDTPLYTRYRTETNTILTLEGYGHLIIV